MSYQTELEKIEQPLTAELYKILVGSVYYYYTSYETSIVYGGSTYLPRPIKRTGFSVEKSMKTVDVTISTPVAVAFGEYLAASPYSKTTVEIYKVFVSSPNTLSKLIFTGMIYSVSIKNGVASALFKSSNGLLARRVPRVIYQTNCNWALFSPQCGLSKSSYAFPAAVGSVSDNDLTLPLLSSVPDKKYQGGILTFGTEQRLITNHVGTTVTILVQFAGIVAGDAVILYPGCNGSPNSCAAFNNSSNFMGMPYIPTRNALMWGFR